ncbi:MAG: tetratricopeptide repeat protein [Ignavibacteria bacterium]|nr:tetratricopeptide repeat protein [Ignavibacteria bacterium]
MRFSLISCTKYVVFLYIIALAMVCPAQSGTALKSRVQELMTQQNYREAIPLLRTILLKDSTDFETAFNLASALQGAGRIQDAQVLLQKLIGSGKRESDVHFLLARNYSLQGLSEDAVKEFQTSWKLDTTNQQALYQLAGAALENQDYTIAISAYNRLLSQDSLDAVSFRQLGICYARIDSLAIALNCLQRSLSLNGRDPVAINQAASVLMKLNRLDSAASALDTAIALYPGVCSFKVFMGDIQLKRRQMLPASAWYAEAMACGDSSAVTCQKYGASVVLFVNKADSVNVNQKLAFYQLAYNALKKSYSLSPKNFITLYYLGQCADKLGKWDEALDYLKQAYSQAIPGITADILSQLGRSSFSRGRYTEALEAYRTAFVLKPGDNDILNAILNIIDMHCENPETSAAYLQFLLERADDNEFEQSVKIRNVLDGLQKPVQSIKHK